MIVYEDVMKDLLAELVRAKKLHPRARRMITALTEEIGELAEALLKVQDEGGGSHEDVYREALHVATVAIRIATEGDESCPRYHPESGHHGPNWVGYRVDLLDPDTCEKEALGHFTMFEDMPDATQEFSWNYIYEKFGVPDDAIKKLPYAIDKGMGDGSYKPPLHRAIEEIRTFYDTYNMGRKEEDLVPVSFKIALCMPKIVGRQLERGLKKYGIHSVFVSYDATMGEVTCIFDRIDVDADNKEFTLPVLNKEVIQILGMPMAYCGTIAHRLVELKHKIEPKAEVEQAYVIHWCLSLYKKYGRHWFKVAQGYLQRRVNVNVEEAVPKQQN